MSERKTSAVRAQCDRCGIVRIRVDAIVLRIAEHDGEGEARFACPRCGLIHLNRVDDEQALALIDGHVTIEWWQLPSDLDEVHLDAPLGESEIDAFAQQLADDAAFVNAFDRRARSGNAEQGHA